VIKERSPYLYLRDGLTAHSYTKLSVEELTSATQALTDMAIIVEMIEEIWAKAFELSHSEAITTYDAAYLGLALLRDARLVTADRKLRDGLSGSLKRHVLLLSTMK